jgi:hypothetical protein
MILKSVIAHFLLPSDGCIGELNKSQSERRQYAMNSRQFRCQQCTLHIIPDNLPPIIEHVPEPVIYPEFEFEDEPIEESPELEVEEVPTFTPTQEIIESNFQQFQWKYDIPVIILVLILLFIIINKIFDFIDFP